MSALTLAEPAGAHVPPGSDEPEHTVLLAALLAGLGTQAPEVAALVTAGADPTSGRRTCIEAGASLVLSASTTSSRVLGVHRRVAPPAGAGTDEHLHWQETRCSATGFTPYARTVLTPATLHGPAQLDALLAHVDAAGRARFRRWHALLGPYGRLYSLRRPLVHGSGQVWVGWQLDRGRAPAAVAQDAALAAAWVAAGEPLSALFPGSEGPADRAVLHSAGPWSLAVALDEPDLLRVGTSRWAFQPDDELKRRRLGRLAADYGSPAFPLGLLRLLTDRVPGRHRVGRAVEVEIRGGVVSSLEFFLAVPPGAGQSQHPHHDRYPREDGPS